MKYNTEWRRWHRPYRHQPAQSRMKKKKKQTLVQTKTCLALVLQNRGVSFRELLPQPVGSGPKETPCVVSTRLELLGTVLRPGSSPRCFISRIMLFWMRTFAASAYSALSQLTSRPRASLDGSSPQENGAHLRVK
eukprot:512067-Amphidinium_carterae.4